MRILLVEDDEILASTLLPCLTHQRYVVELAEDGQLGWEYAQSASYDLILMDVGLPRMDGITLCQRLRSQGCTTPILLMTAKDANRDRIRGLDAGADDYLIKPLDLEELQARVRALLRRGEVIATPVFEIGNLRLDPSSCQVTYAEKLLNLTPKEYNLLELFMRNPSRVFSRGDIVEHLWTFDDPPQEESVKAHIKGLRQKLKAAGAADWVENVYGLGYRLSPKTEAKSKPLERKLGKQKATAKADEQNFSTIAQEFNQQRDRLWLQFQGLMVERLEILQQTAAALRSQTLSPDLRQSATQAAHKLAGVLGMFERDEGSRTAKEIEQLLDGSETLLSEPGNQLLLLIQTLEEQLNLSVQPEEKTAAVTPTARLLLIDSDRQLHAKLEALTQSDGIFWQQVSTLKQAKTWLQNQSPDLVVLSVDEVGQQQDSLSLIANLAQRTPSIPVVVLTGADSLVDRVTVARAGGRGFLVKPVACDRIWAVAAQLLEQARSLTAKLLVVDDDPAFLALLQSMLQPWGIRMTGLSDPLRFWEVLQSVSPDLLILDVEMPDISGIELCQAVRTDPNWQGLPILFLTAHQERSIVQQGFEAGVDDYIIKPVVEPELLARINNRLERTRLLQTLSWKDPLTGLTNQPRSSTELEQLIQAATLNHQTFSLAVLRLAQLQDINLQYGHPTGNQVLQRWSRLFQSALRGGEIVSYWGNGEFIIGMAGLSKAQVSDRLFDLLATLRQQIFTAPDGSRFQPLSQVGIAELPADAQTLQSLYQAAISAIV